MGKVIILPDTTREPITKIGQMAGVCWGADTGDGETAAAGTSSVTPQSGATPSPKGKAYRRGLDCIESGHGRTLEFVNVEMVLDGYSARVIREWYTHIGGAPTRLQASTRYIDYGEFEYVTPPSIAESPAANALYAETMAVIAYTMRRLEIDSFPREDAAMLLPLGMTTRVVDKRNLRNLIDMSRQRMCNRAYWEFRELFRDISCALADYSEEWARIVNTQFMPKCDVLGYCQEKRGCGRKCNKQ